ncbi:MAG: copper homeostasis protein CutC, partial [Muribaculaceae bacterium]|nr:copper homeostasis protein CutC [Muribaculaceae bacterium]
MKRLIEICCADAESVDAAIIGGADRIELCTALSVGGITPSKGLIDYACSKGAIPINVLIRPRPGDFIYNKYEAEIMLADIAYAGKAGASGVVIGALKDDGSIDYDLSKQLVDCAKNAGLSVTFHRAFDLCNDPVAGLEAVMRLGCDRLLTSGQAPDAIKGAAVIAQLAKASDGRLTILAGAGVTPSNIAELIELTGVTEVHASAKTTIESAMRYRNETTTMGSADSDEYSRTVT